MSAGIDYEKQAREEVGQTAVGPRQARLFAVLFLLTLLVVPLIRHAGLGGEIPPGVDPRRLWQTGRAQGVLALHHAVLEKIDAFERELEEGSPLLVAALPWVQTVLSRFGGVGNEEVYAGRDGWLHFRPGVDAVVGKPFLDPAVLEARRRATASWRPPIHPDPLPALIDFHRRLAEHGIRLLVLPVPAKVTVHPRTLGDWSDETVPQNPSFAAFISALEEEGILIYDPAPTLARIARQGEDAYLRTDSHWSPTGVEAVARELAARLRLLELPFSDPERELERRGVEHRAHGDLVRILRLPEEQRLFAEETVTLSQVHDEQAEPWQSDPEAEILLLGDSFANVFSQDALGWGKGAGLAEQLSTFLGRGVERLAQNDGGAVNSRRSLARSLAGGRDRLAGKKLVIYEFAARELWAGDWQIVPLPAVGSSVATFDELRVRGQIAAIATLPPPGSTPYRDALIAVHLRGVEALEGELETGGDGILLYVWGLRDGERTAAASWRSGQSVELELVAWDAVAGELEAYQRLELDDWELFLLPTFWTPYGVE